MYVSELIGSITYKKKKLKTTKKSKVKSYQYVMKLRENQR
jgi:hypothetical protein